MNPHLSREAYAQLTHSQFELPTRNSFGWCLRGLGHTRVSRGHEVLIASTLPISPYLSLSLPYCKFSKWVLTVAPLLPSNFHRQGACPLDPAGASPGELRNTRSSSITPDSSARSATVRNQEQGPYWQVLAGAIHVVWQPVLKHLQCHKVIVQASPMRDVLLNPPVDHINYMFSGCPHLTSSPKFCLFLQPSYDRLQTWNVLLYTCII